MKPYPRKNYGSIGHLPDSRLGEGDHHIQEAQAKILTEKARDYKDLIIVQEKLDGANVGILRHEGKLVGLTRKGHLASDSPMEQFKMFQKWIENNEWRFDFLDDGERVVGEWLAMAHGTRYESLYTPFVAFDLISHGETKLPYVNFIRRLGRNIHTAHLLHIGQPISVKKVLKLLDKHDHETGMYGYHGAIEPVEGAVWRCERDNKVDFLAKFVRHGKEDGKYFNEDHTKLVWNWRD